MSGGGGSGRKSGEKWVDLDAVIIGIKKGHLRFEIFVDPDLAFDYRRGEDIPIQEILKSYEVYEDAKRGEKATDAIWPRTTGDQWCGEWIAKIEIEKEE